MPDPIDKNLILDLLRRTPFGQARNTNDPMPPAVRPNILNFARPGTAPPAPTPFNMPHNLYPTNILPGMTNATNPSPMSNPAYHSMIRSKYPIEPVDPRLSMTYEQFMNDPIINALKTPPK